MIVRSHALLMSTVAAAALTGCESLPEKLPPTERAAQRVEIGMDEVEVTAAIGAPARVHATPTSERWDYCLPGAVADEYIAVDFQHGVVAQVDGALELDFGQCESAVGVSAPAGDSSS